jgi:TolA-binding protein
VSARAVVKDVIPLAALCLIVGCLQTRSELKEQEQKQALQEQVVTLQQTHTQEQIRAQEYEDQFHTQNSRLDQLEKRVATLQEAATRTKDDLAHGRDQTEQKLKAFEEALVKLENDEAALGHQLEDLKKAKAEVPEPKGKGKETGMFQQADDALTAKDYKNAIVLFQKYRDKNPKGKKYAEATFKMGLCFKELGMKPESKTFFEEVIEKFPSSAEAKKAKSQLAKHSSAS